MFPAYSMVPPGIGGYTPYEADYAGLDQLAREDEAAAILAELGYGPDNPLKVELRIYNSDNNQSNAVAIQEELRQLGVEASILNTDVGTHYGIMENGGDFDLGLGGWIADYKDPETFLGLGAAGERQQLFTLRQRGVRAADGRGGRGRGRAGEAHAAPGGGREGDDRRPRLHPAALFQLPQHRLLHALGAGRRMCWTSTPRASSA